MSAIIDIVHEVRSGGDPNRLVQAIPYTRFLGMTLERRDGELIGRLAYSDMLIGNSLIPALHGGTVGAAMESTAIFTLLLEAETLRVPKTINMTIEYLRTGRPEDVFVRAEFNKLGRRIACVRGYAWQQERDRPIATATANLLLRPPAGDPA